MIRRPPRSTPLYSSAASDVYKRQLLWEIGKTSGIFCHGIEEEVIQEYVCMEERDMGVAKLAKEGDKDGLS